MGDWLKEKLGVEVVTSKYIKPNHMYLSTKKAREAAKSSYFLGQQPGGMQSIQKVFYEVFDAYWENRSQRGEFDLHDHIRAVAEQMINARCETVVFGFDDSPEWEGADAPW